MSDQKEIAEDFMSDQKEKAVVKTMALPLPASIKQVSFYFPALKKSAVNPYSFEVDAQDQIILKYTFTGMTIVGKLLGRELVVFEGQPVLAYKIEAYEANVVNMIDAIDKAIKEAMAQKVVPEDAKEVIDEVKAVEAPVKKKASKKKK